MHIYLIITTHDDATRSAMNGYASMELVASGLDPRFMAWIWRNASESDLAQLHASMNILGSVVLV